MDTGVLFLTVKRPLPDVDPSHACSVEIKNDWSYISAPSIRIHNLDTDIFDLFDLSLSKEFFSNLLSLVYQDFICKYVSNKHTNPNNLRLLAVVTNDLILRKWLIAKTR
jgi:hypothetical protein